MSKNIAVLVGSGSQTSYNHIVARHLQNIAPASLKLNIIDIADLPLYDRDLDDQDIPAYTRVREAVAAADAVLWISPEHNGSYSAMLKNAIDVVSRPAGQSRWVGKPLGIVSVNAGGSNRVADQLRVIASGAYINMPVAPYAAAIGGIFSGAFNEQGEIVAENVQKSLQNFITAYADFVAKF